MKPHQKYAAFAKVACATMQRVAGPRYLGVPSPALTIDDVFDEKTQEQIIGKRKKRLSRKRKKLLKKKVAVSRMGHLELGEAKAYVKA